MIDHKITLTLNLSKLAKDFGYNIETDSHEDVWHDGYSADQIRSMSLSLNKELEDADQIFPHEIGKALEDATRDAYAVAIRNERISALEESLEKINLLGGGAEYQSLEGHWVNAKAGVISAKANSDEDTITIEIQNPEHLINAIINGVGMFGTEFSDTEKAEISEIESKIHHLKDYFDVWGESQPKGELSSQYVPSVNDEYFNSLAKENVENLTEEEVAEAVKSVVESEIMSPSEALALAVKLSKNDAKAIRKIIIDSLDKEKEYWTSNL